MSAICGILGKASSEEQRQDSINRMTESMSLIGPDSLNIWKKDHVILAHQALLVTPEEKTDTQPLSLSDEGLTIVFDGRIYNRGEILETLKNRPDPNSPDALLLLKLYKQIGVDAFHKANGEFVLAIYDHHRHELLLARDPVGNRVLYYAETSFYFVFASSTDAIASIADVETVIDPIVLASYLLSSSDLAYGRTLYKAINCLPPAHSIKITKDRVIKERYYRFSSNLNDSKLPIKRAIEGLRYEIERSVQNRIANNSLVGTSLSGGLDSSGVTAIAAEYMGSKGQKIHAFSGVPTQATDQLSIEEIGHIKTVASEFPNIENHLIASDRIGPFSGLERHVAVEDLPLGPFYYMYDLFCDEATKKGIRTFLTGSCGDLLVSAKGFGSLIHQLSPLSPFSSCHNFIQNFNKHISIKSFIAQELVFPVFPICLSLFLTRKSRTQAILSNSLLKEDFIRSNGIDELLKDKSLFSNKIFRDPLTRAAETYDQGLTSHFASQFGRKKQLEFLNPLEDLRLIEFCLALPIASFGYGAQSRGFYREAMKGVIPNSVRKRKTKGAFIPLFHRNVRKEKEIIGQLLKKMPDSHEIWRVIDQKRFQTRLNAVLSDPNDYQTNSWNPSIQLDILPIIAFGLFMNLKT